MKTLKPLTNREVDGRDYARFLVQQWIAKGCPRLISWRRAARLHGYNWALLKGQRKEGSK